MNGEKRNIDYQDYDLADIITGKPHDFRVGDRRFRIYPVTLGKMLILRPYMDAVSVESLMGANPYTSALKFVREKKELCATILAIHTARNRRDCVLGLSGIQWRTDFFAREINDEDLASLLVVILTGDRTQQMIERLGLDKERGRLEEALKVKQDRNTLSFGAKSIFGSFIAPLKEMGFSTDEIIFECGYSFLRLMLMDKQVSLYMSDEEIQQMGGSAGALIDGDGADADNQLKAFFSSKGVSVK